MDSIRLVLTPASYDERGRTQAVRFIVNGEDLVAIVRRVEEPYALAEGTPETAGGYEGLPVSVVRPPSRHLLGDPEPLYRDEGRVEILTCAGCGEPGCWPLLARIKVEDEQIIWRDFALPHRDGGDAQPEPWSYDLGPFVFDRSEYEEQVGGLATSG